jgi:hypothetical protein
MRCGINLLEEEEEEDEDSAKNWKGCMSVVMQIASLNWSKSRANKVSHSLGSVIQKSCYQISRSLNGDKKGS